MTDTTESNPPKLTPLRLFFLKNAVAATAMVCGWSVIGFSAFLSVYSFTSPFPEMLRQEIVPFDFIADVLIICLAGAIVMIYERPYREYLNRMAWGEEIDAELKLRAQKRLLNEQVFIIKLFVILWFIGAAAYFFLMRGLNMDWLIIRLNLADSLFMVIVAVTLAINIQLSLLQQYIVPYFFPEGKLHDFPGGKEFSMRLRMFMLLVVLNIAPLGAIMRTQIRVANMGQPPDVQFTLMSHALYFLVPLSVSIGIIITLLFISNSTKSIEHLHRVLHKIAQGRYDVRVRVTSNDEIGYAGDVVNDMTRGLLERERMRKSLNLAREVQQNLLPKHTPQIDGLDVAGATLPCDETGGDYFDYLGRHENNASRLSVVVGDVSGHGVPSALLMATVRAFIRLRSYLPGSPTDIVRSVNRQLCRDVEESGQFMTLFFMEVDSANQRICWITAGHDPALIYDPVSDTFEELGGHGLALGIDYEFPFQETFRNIKSGQIIVLATDGIWETVDVNGQPFGKNALREIIRLNADCSAREIVDTVLDRVVQYCHPHPRMDDLTLLVIKMEPEKNREKGRL